jgi:formamidopyrimidine-DNA glycosylase
MPELAEVEYFRRRWDSVAGGRRVERVLLHAAAKVFRGADVEALRRGLTGARYVSSAAAAKQILVRFSGDAWLGVHLGMSGELSVAPADYRPQRHDHLVLTLADRALVFSDPRMFGRIRFDRGAAQPRWWTDIAPAILSPGFTHAGLSSYLQRRRSAPIKAVLLMQERFPGIGNWMADEILWRAALHPRRAAGSLSDAEQGRLWRECREVCRLALRRIAGLGSPLPASLNIGIPRTWLFWHRWEAGGRCPRTGGRLARAEIGGRTTCWSPQRQRLGG